MLASQNQILITSFHKDEYVLYLNFLCFPDRILQITALTNAKDHERLALLKEVAGTKVYEQRRAESLRIMAETDAKRTKINELIDYIESRLTELEEEKDELREFQDKDKERRCLEYALYQRELEEVGEALEEIDEERRGEVHGANMRRDQYDAREKEIQVCNPDHGSPRLLITFTALRATNITSETLPAITPNITEGCTIRAQ